MAPAARAETVTAYYEATWATLPAATMVLSMERDGPRYRGVMRVETVGLPRWILHFRTQVESDGTFADDGAALPAHYNVDYDLRKYKNQRIRVNFVMRDGKLVAERTHDDSSNKPPLPEKYRTGIVDPMSAFAAIREFASRHALKTGDTDTIPIFDDVRRYDARIAVTKVDPTTKLNDLHIDLLPIAGFKYIKPEKGQAEDAARPLDVTFRDDGKLFPAKLVIDIGLIP
ncbi:MAG: DUF3108 domain-containing protein, partial [Stellaceae bacterium]